MTKWMLAAGAAALAMTAPALADKGGNGHGKGGGNAKVERGNSGGKSHVQREAKADRNDSGFGHARQEKHANKPVRVADHDRDRGREMVRADKNDRVKVSRDDRGYHDDRNFKTVKYDRDADHVRFLPRWDNRGLVRYDGCPPGLAKKGNGCLPPGQAKKIVGTSLPSVLASRVLGGPYRDWYRDNDRYYYRWDDDYIYRVNRNGGLIDALFPYANRDYYYYPVGYQYPSSYNYYNVPYQYRTYYPDRNDMWYRYGDGAIYGVNPSTGLIQGIAALLAGDLSVGQPLPQSYSVYNVPLSYRDQYYDTPNDWYRYNDGYIYRVDPTTQLITAVINAIV